MLCSCMLKVNIEGDSSDHGAMQANVSFVLENPLVSRGNIPYYIAFNLFLLSLLLCFSVQAMLKEEKAPVSKKRQRKEREVTDSHPSSFLLFEKQIRYSTHGPLSRCHFKQSLGLCRKDDFLHSNYHCECCRDWLLFRRYFILIWVLHQSGMFYQQASMCDASSALKGQFNWKSKTYFSSNLQCYSSI